MTGNQKGMQIFDPMVFVNIERYQKINIHAQNLDQVYPNKENMSVVNNMTFFNQCLKRFPIVSFSLTQGAKPYLTVRHKNYAIGNQEELDRQREDAELSLLFEQILASRIFR